jgi:hypothetical protein
VRRGTTPQLDRVAPARGGSTLAPRMAEARGATPEAAQAASRRLLRSACCRMSGSSLAPLMFFTVGPRYAASLLVAHAPPVPIAPRSSPWVPAMRFPRQLPLVVPLLMRPTAAAVECRPIMSPDVVARCNAFRSWSAVGAGVSDCRCTLPMVSYCNPRYLITISFTGFNRCSEEAMLG